MGLGGEGEKCGGVTLEKCREGGGEGGGGVFNPEVDMCVNQRNVEVVAQRDDFADWIARLAGGGVLVTHFEGERCLEVRLCDSNLRIVKRDGVLGFVCESMALLFWLRGCLCRCRGKRERRRERERMTEI